MKITKVMKRNKEVADWFDERRRSPKNFSEGLSVYEQGIQEGKEIALKDIVDTARCNHDEGVMEERKRVLEIVSERIKNIDGRFVHSIAVICELNNLKRAIQNGEKS